MSRKVISCFWKGTSFKAERCEERELQFIMPTSVHGEYTGSVFFIEAANRAR